MNTGCAHRRAGCLRELGVVQDGVLANLLFEVGDLRGDLGAALLERVDLLVELGDLAPPVPSR